MGMPNEVGDNQKNWWRFLLDRKTGTLGRDGVAGIVPFHQSAFYEPFDFLW